MEDHIQRVFMHLIAACLTIKSLRASLPEAGTPKGAGNIYGLKVYYQLIPVGTPDQELLLDVERTFNSAPHHLQRTLNYLESWWGYLCQRPYYVDIEALYTMLTILIGHRILPTTTDHGFLTNAWQAYSVWNAQRIPGVLRPFQETLPLVKRIRLQTSSGRPVILRSSSRLELQEFKAMGISLTTFPDRKRPS